MTDRLADYLAAHVPTARLITLPDPARTVPDAARLLDTKTDRVVKSIVVTDGDACAVLVVAGTAQADLDAAARELGWSAASMADPATARDATGYAIGGTPPVGHATRLPVLVDEAVAKQDTVFGGGGRPERLLDIAPGAILALSEARVARLTDAT